VIAGAVYGGQVCPLLDSLGVWKLGLILFFPLGGAFALRALIEGPLMKRHPPTRHAFVQFSLDLALFSGASLAAAALLRLLYGFGFFQSGLKIALGLFAVGLFAALDLSLERERKIIGKAQHGQASYAPPRCLIPMARKFILVTVSIVVLATAIILLVLIRDLHWLSEQVLTPASFDVLGRSVLIEILFVMGFLLVMVVNLAFSYATNLRLLFGNETDILERVSRGDLSRRVPVVTCDEMGVIAAHTNAMISALRVGRRMSDGLRIAKEVQQNLLPEHAPVIPGLELAGTARFSDETGGDFYDYIGCDDEVCGRIAVAVGDVSGHGIGAALLMAAGRALVRQSAASPGSPALNITAANHHLARDIDNTGRFMTLFFMILDPAMGTATWVNAGHQPPLVYDPADDSFSELRGGDIPLGVTRSWNFHQQTMDLPGPGQIILIGTDGMWEAHNHVGEMFGPARVQRVLRDTADKSAEAILDALMNAVNDFVGATPQEDDITLVVIKGVEPSRQAAPESGTPATGPQMK
jgi:sigma-B regulation protein RsbU (phosphoserine phosphatase)